MLEISEEELNKIKSESGDISPEQKFIYDSPVNPLMRQSEEIAGTEGDYRQAYYGKIIPTEMTPSVGFLYNAYITPIKSTARGAIGIGVGTYKTVAGYAKEGINLIEDMLEERTYSKMRQDLAKRRELSEISQEQYENALADLEKTKQENLVMEQNFIKARNKEALQMLSKADLFKFKAQEFLKLNPKKGEWKWLQDVFESGASTLGAIGIGFLTKNPAAMWAFFTASQTGDMVQQELQYGEDLSSALLTGTTTMGISSTLDTIGAIGLGKLFRAPARVFATKMGFLNKITAWAAGKENGKTILNGIGLGARTFLAGAAEEGSTEFTQGIIESNLPRFLGKGTPFTSFTDEILDYSYQGLLGALSGGAIGSIGSSINYHATYKNIKSIAQDKLKLNESDAKEIAAELAPVVVEHEKDVIKQAAKNVTEIDSSNKGVENWINVVTGATYGNEQAQIRQVILDTLNKQSPNTKEANEIAAGVLSVSAQIEASLLDGDAQKTASSYNVKIEQNESDMDVSDDAYNARVKKEGKISVEGYVKKQLGQDIIYLLNNGSPDTIIHEAGHLLLKTVTHALQITGQDAFKHPFVNAIVETIGLPNANGEFSEEQHEQFARALQEYALEGVAPNPEMMPVFKAHKAIMDNIAKTAIKQNVLTEKGRENLATLFARDEAVLPDFDITEQNVEALLETIKLIKQGKTASIKNVKVLAELANLKRARIPIPTGYSANEFIAEHPEYETLSDKEKVKMLKDSQFVFPEEVDKLSPKEKINWLNKNGDNVFSEANEKTKERQEYIKKYNKFKELADSLFPQKQQEFIKLNQSILNVLNSGKFVITDEAFMKDVSTALKNMLSKLRKYNKKELKEASDNGLALASLAKDLIIPLYAAGINVEGINELSSELEIAIQNNNLTKTNDLIESLRNRLESATNSLIERYIDSKYYEQNQGIQIPIPNRAKMVADISSIVTKAVAKGQYIRGNNQVLKAIRTALRKQNLSENVISKIVNKLITSNISLLGNIKIHEVLDSIIKEVAKEYNGKMSEKIDSAWNDLIKKANNNELTYSDKLFVKWVQENLFGFSKKMNKKSTKKKAIKTTLPLYLESVTSNLKDVVLGKDPTKPKEEQDIKLTEEQKQFVKDVTDFLLAKHADYENVPSQYRDMYKNIMKLSYLTGDFAERMEREKREKLSKLITSAIQVVSGRKDIPYLGKLDRFLFTGNFSGLRSDLIKVFGESLGSALDIIVEENTQKIVKDRIYERLNDVIHDVTKGNVSEYIVRLNVEKPFANAKEGTLEYKLKDYTRGQLLSQWIQYKNKFGQKWVEKEFGDNTEAIMKLVENRLREDDVVIAEHMMETLKELYPDVDRVYFEINGKPMGMQRAYFPLVTEYLEDGKAVQSDLNSFVPEVTEITEQGYQKQRTGPSGDRKAVWENPIETYKRYVNTATKYIYIVQKLNTLSQMLKGNTKEAKALQETIKDRFGEETLVALQNEISVLMNIGKQERLSALDKILHEFISNSVVAMLGLKPMVGIKQIPAAFNFAQMMPPGSFFTYLNQALKDPKKTWKYMMNHEVIKDRFVGEELPIAFAENKSMLIDTLFSDSPQLNEFLNKNKKARQLLGKDPLAKVSSWLSTVKNKAMLNVRLGDIMAVIYGGYAYEMYLRDKIANDPAMKDVSQQEKEEYIERELVSAIQTTQQSSLGTTRGLWQQNKAGISGVLSRAAFTFSSAQLQFVRKIREAAYSYRNGDISKEQFYKTVLIYGFVQPTFYSLLSSPFLYLSVIGGLLGLRDDDDWKKEVYLTAIRPYIDNIAGAGGSLGNILTFLTDKVAELGGQSTYGSDLDINPAILTNISKAAKKISRSKIENGTITVEDLIGPLLALGETTTAMPLQTGKNILKGLFGVGKGVASEEERDLILRGFANMIGMSEKQIKVFLDKK